MQAFFLPKSAKNLPESGQLVRQRPSGLGQQKAKEGSKQPRRAPLIPFGLAATAFIRGLDGFTWDRDRNAAVTRFA
jgi:hypothetical protein